MAFVGVDMTTGPFNSAWKGARRELCSTEKRWFYDCFSAMAGLPFMYCDMARNTRSRVTKELMISESIKIYITLMFPAFQTFAADLLAGVNSFFILWIMERSATLHCTSVSLTIQRTLACFLAHEIGSFLVGTFHFGCLGPTAASNLGCALARRACTFMTRVSANMATFSALFAFVRTHRDWI
jgi:hypothetical protein